MEWTGRKVLVTGAGGFIGSHLTERLVNMGAHVRAFVRYNSRGDPGLLSLLPEKTLSGVTVIAGDLQDEHAVGEAVRGTDTIFHLGALISIPYSYRHPREVVEANVMGTLNLLMAARTHGVSRLVHTSTSEVYGTAQYVPIDENHPLRGQSPYSASKIGADKLVESFSRSFDLPVATLRPFNTYGPRQSARAVIPTIVTQVLTCDVLHLGSLTPLRDLLYVDDTVEGFLRTGWMEAAVGQEFNIGSGEPVSIGDLAHKIMELVGRTLPIEVQEERLRPVRSEVMCLHADSAKARAWLDWRPRVQLDEGLGRAITWIRDNLSRYRPGTYEV